MGDTHYEVLGIPPRADLQQVEKAYRYCLSMYDEGSVSTYSLLDPAELRRARARVKEAYEVLRDPVRRHEYDVARGASASKIGVRFLEYIEADRFDMLPAHVYLRGFVQEYARAVGLDPRRTAESYLSRIPRR
jgi:flagellar biosynthesis protein FlhG